MRCRGQNHCSSASPISPASISPAYKHLASSIKRSRQPNAALGNRECRVLSCTTLRFDSVLRRAARHASHAKDRMRPGKSASCTHYRNLMVPSMCTTSFARCYAHRCARFDSVLRRMQNAKDRMQNAECKQPTAKAEAKSSASRSYRVLYHPARAARNRENHLENSCILIGTAPRKRR